MKKDAAAEICVTDGFENISSDGAFCVENLSFDNGSPSLLEPKLLFVCEDGMCTVWHTSDPEEAARFSEVACICSKKKVIYAW